MARIASLNVLLSTTGNDYLKEEYGAVIANVQKNTISQRFKNKDLSGTPGAGTYEAKRFENKTSKAYGTARQGGAGEAVKVTPVPVPVNVDKEIVVEVEQKDVTLYGVDSLIQREAASAQKSMTRELERAFYSAAATAATTFTTQKTNINEIMEDFIEVLETVSNNFVDGVERDMMVMVCKPATYGALRNYFDNVQGGNMTAETFPTFHGVKVFSSVYLPAGVNALIFTEGAIAQPVLPTVAPAERIQLSNAIGFGLFYSYGTTVVAPDLVFKY